MAEKSPIITFSSSKAVETNLNRLQKQFGKNRSQIIRDLVTDAVNYPKNRTSVTQGISAVASTNQEFVINNFFSLMSEYENHRIYIVSQAVVIKNNKVLLVLPKKCGQLIKNSTWEFPSVISKSLFTTEDLVASVKKHTNLNICVEKFICGRLIPDRTVGNILLLSANFYCKIISGKVSGSNMYQDTRWVPVNEVSRYITNSIGDNQILWFSKLK